MHTGKKKSSGRTVVVLKHTGLQARGSPSPWGQPTTSSFAQPGQGQRSEAPPGVTDPVHTQTHDHPSITIALSSNDIPASAMPVSTLDLTYTTTTGRLTIPFVTPPLDVITLEPLQPKAPSVPSSQWTSQLDCIKQLRQAASQQLTSVQDTQTLPSTPARPPVSTNQTPTTPMTLTQGVQGSGVGVQGSPLLTPCTAVLRQHLSSPSARAWGRSPSPSHKSLHPSSTPGEGGDARQRDVISRLRQLQTEGASLLASG